MMHTLSLVALGGAIGASLRYLWSVAVVRLTGPMEVPVAIMGANILGSFLMGAFVVLAAHKGLTAWSPFVMTGLLGGFTTFSAFSLETMTLIERGAIGQAAIYAGASVVFSILALAMGMWATRMVVA